MSVIDNIIKPQLRLKYIKLAGFKSFVDSSTLHFPSHLVGIVGPNGCGKSNIIDAVRWVLGESSAKSLRAETGTDVIFNGASERKPVGQAFVELIFDNPPGAVSGEYAAFRELSIKRSLDREGQSIYYLNQVRCRRRDVTDLFAGTGLGPRSYAVIEQGMITRLIEAKPEELRVYLEEAAGISRYHERRRETEVSMRHTRDNMLRLSDLIHELSQQLEKLAEQANKAQQYQLLQQQLKQAKQGLLIKQWFMADSKRRQWAQAKQAVEAEITDKVSSLETLETQLVDLRELASERYQTVNAVQTQFYQLGADVGRMEQQLTALSDALEKTEHEIKQHETQAQLFTSQLTQDKAQEHMLQSLLQQQIFELETCVAEQQRLHESLQAMEVTYQESQRTLQPLAQVVQQANIAVQVLQTERQQIVQNQQRLSMRLEKLTEAQTKQPAISEDNVRELQQQCEATQSALNDIDVDLATQQQQLAALLPQIGAKEKVYRDQQRRVLQQEAQLSSLQRLQQAALGQDNHQQQTWLTLHDLVDQRLGQLLTVQPEWTLAVEALLGDWLQAVVVDTSFFASLAQSTPPAGSVFLCAQTTALDWPDTLASVVDKPALLPKAMHQVYLAKDLTEALERLPQLDSEASVILPDGLWLSRTWIRVPAQHTKSDSILARAEAIQQLKAELADLQATVTTDETALHLLINQRESLQVGLDTLRDQRQDKAHLLAKQEATWTIKQADYRRMQAEQERDSQALFECQQDMQQWAEKLLVLETSEQQANVVLAERMLQQQDVAQQHEALQQQLQTLRPQERACQHHIHELKLQSQRSETQLATLRQKQQTAQQQQDSRETRLVTLQQQHEQDMRAHMTLTEYLQAALHKRLAAEAEVTKAKEQHEQSQLTITEVTALRQQAQQTLDTLRAEDAKLIATQEAEAVRYAHWQNEARTWQLTWDDTMLPTEPTATITEFMKQVNALQAQLTQLEPVNLTAIDEYQEMQTRCTYLQAQHQDLHDAVSTLEQAIVTMDKETRVRLRDTFDQVNAGFQALFPRIFGGGHAYLSLTEEELLTAGITVMARPPGKKNSSIQLLSGGEKALTAIALIFAIFQLNPAPFCLLDEVDAPLDEANVHRYCDLIRDMSASVQFIFISHNRVTMALAEQLVGVTMKEPGVSRLVAVNLTAILDELSCPEDHLVDSSI